MRKTAVALGSAALLTAGMAAPALAGPPVGAGEGGQPTGVACQQFGISVLQDTGVLPSVAKDGLAFPIGSENIFSFSDVLEIHRTDPATANVVLKAYAAVLLPGMDVDDAIDAACPA